MRRRDFFLRAAPWGALAAIGGYRLTKLAWGAAGRPSAAESPVTPLTPPSGTIPVAFVLSAGAVMIDFAGPWEVFQDVMIMSRGSTMADQMPFRPYTVSDQTAPIRASDGMRIVPDHSFADAPAPKVIVLPAQNEASPAMLDWIRRASRQADCTMSVCTGAFLLAQTGLLDGKAATTHHSAYRRFAMQFPRIRLVRGARFVDEGHVASSGGLSSGIDLALHVVERYFGRGVAQATADQMEYQGRGWLDPASNAKYAGTQDPADRGPHCPVCGMTVNVATAPTSVLRGHAYYFCSAAHKAIFDAAPARWIPAS